METQVLTRAGYKHFGGNLALISGQRGYALKFEITCGICIHANGVTLTELGCEGSWPELKKFVDLLKKRRYRDVVQGPLFQAVKSECSAAALHVSTDHSSERARVILRAMLNETLRMSFDTECNESFGKYSKPLLEKELCQVRRSVSAILFWLIEVACKNRAHQLVETLPNPTSLENLHAEMHTKDKLETELASRHIICKATCGSAVSKGNSHGSVCVGASIMSRFIMPLCIAGLIQVFVFVFWPNK